MSNLTEQAKTIKKNMVLLGDESWNIVLNIMTGICMAVKSAETMKQEIRKQDFQLKYYFELVPRRSGNEKLSFKVCKFSDYAPNVFT